MKFHFEKQFILLLLPVLLIFFWYTGRKLEINKMKKRLLLLVRSLLIIVLIFSLSGLSLVWKAKDTSTIFLVDSSDSISNNKEKIEEFVKKSIENKKRDDLVGIMTFGQNAIIENFVSKKTIFSGIQTEPVKSYTNIENAIVSGLLNIGEGNKKRIVLITDGKENQGESSKLISTLKEQKVDFKVYEIGNDEKKDAAIHKVEVPENVRVGEEFNVIVNIKSNINTNCKVNFFSDNAKKGESTVKITKGDNRFIFKDKAKEGGFKTYKVVIEPEGDQELRNNEASAFTNVKHKVKILVIEDNKKDSSEMINILRASNVDFQLVKAGAEPSDIKTLSKYKSIITCNVSSENLSSGFLNSLNTYVRDLGGGFIAVGGDNSFALGGYAKTPLEDVLPVYMDMRGKKEIPSIAMMLVIDRSGSMSGEKMELAKEAAARTSEFLREKDEIGVIAFDDAQYWVVKRQNVKDRKTIRDSIGTIRSGGGTSILPALYEGYNSLKGSKAEIKHMILLTDGQAEREGYDTLIRDFKNKNITVSTVAVGSDSDRILLKNIAKGARGRFYYTDNSGSIPRIFAKETFMAARTYLNNKKFTPVVQSSHAVLSGVYENGFPDLLGYIGATPKKTSKVVLKTPEDDPILTVWQYGLGKTAAWNSDMNGKWSKNFISWDKNLKIWQNLINWSIENYNNDSMHVNTKLDGEKGVIEVQGTNLGSSSVLEAQIITPSMKNKKIKLYPKEINKFSGEFTVDENGVYIVKAKDIKNGQIVNSAMGAMSMDYSPEYRIDGGKGSLEELVKGVEGKYINSPNEVFQGNLEDVYTKRELSSFFIALAIILFVFDIAIRKLEFPYIKLENKVKSILSRINLFLNPNKKIVQNKNKKEKVKEIFNEETEEKKLEQNTSKKTKETLYKNNIPIDKKAKGLSQEETKENDSLNTSELLKIKKNKRKS
ncbi:VWA domain-containing protein [Haloimpatiens massiliensis]|uniref:VWA domain-containing protein n=1 Tax=Haloimpatiens massiliensis TaxID=1658110 RepID=UPI000C864AE8|nr:VWA domain-containing protein [Haloimpatiens massiliensis]